MKGRMKTVLDVTSATHSRGGVGRWIAGLSKGLQNANPHHASLDVPETHPGLKTPVDKARLLPTPLWLGVPLLRRQFLRLGRLEATREKRIRRILGTPDIMHLSGVQPFGAGKIKVVTFFDDTPWTSPESHTEHTLFYANRLENLIRGGAAVLAISGWAAERARKRFDIPAERIGIAGGAADDSFHPGEPDPGVLGSFDLEPDRYFLHVGSFVPRKNIPFLTECFQKAQSCGAKLVLAGSEKWGDQGFNSSERIICLERVTDLELLSLYRGARAVFIPSAEEGLGLPLLEALACGTPVVSSDGGALPETVEKAGLVLPVLDSRSWVAAITDLAKGTTLSTLRNMAASHRRTTWNCVAARAMAFYESLLEQRSSKTVNQPGKQGC